MVLFLIMRVFCFLLDKYLRFVEFMDQVVKSFLLFVELFKKCESVYKILLVGYLILFVGIGFSIIKIRKYDFRCMCLVRKDISWY